MQINLRIMFLLIIIVLTASCDSSSGKDPSGASSSSSLKIKNQSLTVEEDKQVSFKIAALSDKSVTYSIVKSPAHGKIVGNVFTPAANYHGKDSFTFKVKKGKKVSNTATVNLIIKGVNDAPVITTGKSLTTYEDNSVSINLVATDVDGDSLTYSAVTQPLHGKVRGNRYIPNANYHGEDSFIYKANDGESDSNIVTIRVTVISVNDPPIANSKIFSTWDTDSVTFQLSGSDGDGDSLTYQIINQPSNGTISGNIYTPNVNSRGEDSFTYVANDGTSDSSPAIMTINVKAPFITTWKTDNVGVSEDTQITIHTGFYFSYNFDIDWGDGSVDKNITNTIVHDYDLAGIYTVKISGKFPRLSGPFWTTVETKHDHKKLMSIEQWGDIEWHSMVQMFSQASNLMGNATDIPDLTQVTDMTRMFYLASVFNQPLNDWDVSSVESMANLFRGAFAFNQPLDNWDVTSVKNMYAMFSGARNFDQPLNNWNVSSVEKMNYMFNSAAAFNQPLDNWDVSSVTNMANMFSRTESFNQDIGGWDVLKVSNLYSMFKQTESFNQDLSRWDITQALSMKYMFSQSSLSSSNYDALLQAWSTKNVKEGIEFGAQGIKYSTDSQSARDTLENDYGWVIIDGGLLN